jgi:hypothetical protein
MWLYYFIIRGYDNLDREELFYARYYVRFNTLSLDLLLTAKTLYKCDYRGEIQASASLGY